MGERSRESYKSLFDAGNDRYLLRHETADKTHYEKLQNIVFKAGYSVCVDRGDVKK